MRGGSNPFEIAFDAKNDLVGRNVPFTLRQRPPHQNADHADAFAYLGATVFTTSFLNFAQTKLDI